MTVTVETTPWPDFQTKAFTEFNAKGDAYDMVVGDCQWLGAGSTGGHYVDLTDFFKQAQARRDDGAGHGQVLRRISGQRGKYWAIPARGRRHRLGLPQGLVRGPEGDGSLQGQVRLRPRRAEGLQGSCATSPSSSTGRTRTATASRIYTDNSYDALVMGVENALFSYGGDSATTRPTRSTASSTPTRTSRRSRSTGSSTSSRRRTGARPSSRGQPGDHRGPGGDEHELLRLLPGAGQRGDQPARRGHRLLRQPARARRRPASPRSAARASRSSPTRRTRKRR